MKGRQVALGVYKDRAAAALMVDGKLEDFLIEADDATPAPGAIYRGIVDRQMKGQGGVFLRLGNGQRGFLRQAKGLAPGQPLLVQVVSHAEPGKAPPLTTRILFKSRYAIVTPDAPGVNISRQIREEEDRDRIAEIAHGIELAEGHGAILRSAARLASDEEIADDLAAMADLAEAVMSDAQGSEPELLVDAPDPAHLAWREWADPAPDQILEEDDAFEIAGVLDALEDLYRGEALASGGSMIVEPTRALVAVDVNTGGDSSPAAGLKANIDAARALPRALRLQGLGGQIVVDFAPMPKKDRKTLEQSLRAAFKADAVETNLVGWTSMGLFELQRKRERLPLHEARP